MVGRWSIFLIGAERSISSLFSSVLVKPPTQWHFFVQSGHHGCFARCPQSLHPGNFFFFFDTLIPVDFLHDPRPMRQHVLHDLELPQVKQRAAMVRHGRHA